MHHSVLSGGMEKNECVSNFLASWSLTHEKEHRGGGWDLWAHKSASKVVASEPGLKTPFEATESCPYMFSFDFPAGSQNRDSKLFLSTLFSESLGGFNLVIPLGGCDWDRGSRRLTQQTT